MAVDWCKNVWRVSTANVM